MKKGMSHSAYQFLEICGCRFQEIGGCFEPGRFSYLTIPFFIPVGSFCGQAAILGPASDLGAASLDGPDRSLADLLASDGAGPLRPGRQPLRG